MPTSRTPTEPHDTQTPARGIQHFLPHFGLHFSSSSALEHDDVGGLDVDAPFLSELIVSLQHEHDADVYDDVSDPVEVPRHSEQSQLPDDEPLTDEYSLSDKHVVFFDSVSGGFVEGILADTGRDLPVGHDFLQQDLEHEMALVTVSASVHSLQS